MPFKSDKQRKYFNANRGKLEAEGVNVDEWNSASKGMDLPEKVRHDKGPGHHFRKAGGKRGTK